MVLVRFCFPDVTAGIDLRILQPIPVMLLRRYSGDLKF
jgi:hypothetical protein